MRETSFASWIRTHQLILLTVGFFLVWKLTLVFLLWQDRSSPPEPDDSYSYISTIASTSTCRETFLCSQYENSLSSDYASYVQFSYRIFFGGLARIFSLSPETMYAISFYIGTILLIPSLLLFLKSLTKNRILLCLGIVFLAFYHGTGETHGFYWVVPSFFSALLFFVIVSFVIEKSPSPWQYWVTPLLVPFFILMHPTSAYFLIVFIIYIALHSIFEKRLDRESIRKFLAIFLISIITITIQSVLMARNGQENPYGIEAILPQATGILSKLRSDANSLISYDITPENHLSTTEKNNVSYLSNRFETLKLTYFRWFFPHWIVIFPFVFLLWLLHRNREYKVLSMYGAAFIFFIISTLTNQFGFRSGIILWPITYLVYAFGIYYLLLLIRTHLSEKPILYRSSIGIIGIGCALFVFLNVLYAITINTNLNARNDYEIDKGSERYLLENTNLGDTLYIPRLVRQSIFGSELFFRNKILPPEQNPKYIASLRPKPFQSSIMNRQVRGLTDRILLLAGKPPLSVATFPNDRLDTPSSDYRFERSFGDVLIYRNTSL